MCRVTWQSEYYNSLRPALLKLVLILFFIYHKNVTLSGQEVRWQRIDDGLFYSEIANPIKSEYGDLKITVLKVDPKYFHFRLISSKEKQEWNVSAKEWASREGLSAVVNAGMFKPDNKTNAGYMKNYDFVNNSEISKDNTVTAFNRKDTSVPEFQIIDLKCQSWDELKGKYNSYTQNIRMIDCHQKNVWAQQTKKFSMVIIACDKDGNALFIFTRSPYSGHDFITILLEMPLNIYNAMYLEGGPEASFYVNHNGVEIEKFGSYETGYQEDDNVVRPSDIPNIIGIVKKN